MWRNRSKEKEWLDDLEQAGPDLATTLHQLSLINRWLGTHISIIRALPKMLADVSKTRKIRIVDLGCGGGDLLRKLASWGRKNAYQFDLIGIDGNANTLAFAAKQSQDFPEISYLKQDLLANTQLPSETDLVISSQFLYHYSDQALAELFKQLPTQCSLGLISSDLHRHPLAHFAFATLTRLLPVHPMIRHDGLQAIKRGFRRSELLAILQNSGLSQFRLRWVWAFRFQLLIFTTAYA
ncbi:MAG: methyltransferase domain-containing protein [Bacteroidota bacterium]